MNVRVRHVWVHAVRLALSVCCLATLQPARASQESDDEAFVVIKAGKIVTMAGDDIRDGVIVIVNGKVRAVGKGLDYPGNAKFIDARSLVVMPGMINPHTRIGMPRYTRSGVHGDLTVAAEYLPNESLNKDLLDSGYTVLGLYAAGRGVPGRGLVVRTGGDTAVRTLLDPAHLWIGFDKKATRAALKKAQAEIDKVEKARKEFDEKDDTQSWDGALWVLTADAVEYDNEVLPLYQIVRAEGALV